LLAILVARNRDIAAAEDALSGAFEAALRQWPERGVPQNPQAWLITTAGNTLSNQARHHGVARAAVDEVHSYQPYWVTRRAVLRGLGRQVEAEAALAQALALTEDESLRRHLAAGV
jgi:predicted RNA polymerase sigma factor